MSGLGSHNVAFAPPFARCANPDPFLVLGFVRRKPAAVRSRADERTARWACRRRLASGVLDRLGMLVAHPVDALGQQRVAVAQFAGDGVDRGKAAALEPAHAFARAALVASVHDPTSAADTPITGASAELYSTSMTGRIGAKGQVVIPKAIRVRANLHPGDEVDFELRDDEIVLVARRSPARLGGRFANSGMAARLLIDRAGEPR